MEEGSQASGKEQSESEVSMPGGGTQDDDPLLSPNSELMKSPPEDAHLGKYINSIDTLSNNEKYQLLTQPFIPPKHYKFPQCNKYGKNRSFQINWLEKYNGLVYSPSLQGGLCKYCILFAKTRESLGTFVNSPFTELWKASEKLKQHFCKEKEMGKETHRHAMEAALHFKMIMEGKAEPISRQLDREVSERVAINRSKLSSIVKTVILCGQQNISLRGHRDDSKHVAESESNLGNFHALLRFRIDAGDKVLEEHFETAGKNCTYRSKTIQNELIEVCGDYIRNRLLAEIREAQFFAISADEVADLSNREQMSLVVRFVDRDKNVREEFPV